MDTETKNLVNSFLPTDFTWIKKGSLGIYREGIIKVQVKVLAVRIKNNNLELKLECLEQSPYTKVFDVCADINYLDSYVGWNLQPMPDLN